MSMPGPMELGLILVVALLIFGPKRITEVARGLGQGLREFKKTISDINKD